VEGVTVGGGVGAIDGDLAGVVVAADDDFGGVAGFGAGGVGLGGIEMEIDVEGVDGAALGLDEFEDCGFAEFGAGGGGCDCGGGGRGGCWGVAAGGTGAESQGEDRENDTSHRSSC